MATRIAALTRVSRGAGNYVSASESARVGVYAVEIALDRTAFSAGAAPVTFGLEVSFDGGASWVPWGSATTSTPGTTPGTESWLRVPLPDTQNALRRVRATMVLKEDAVAAVDIRTSP